MKTKRIVLICVLLTFCVAVIAVLYMLGIIPHRTYDNEHFGIADYISRTDKDHDGIDDQTDVLIGVRDYIKTKPKYKSKYYASGYPDDGYGVCTDVIAFGLVNAGYDLKELVNEDILENREMYSIETVDKNIDFRRVRNLLVFFKNNAISLSCDPADIGQWQGGDIVVFKKHIGIVSDRRNRRGVPLVIHHGSPVQLSYEQDILEKRSAEEDIIGHFRIS